MSKRLEQNESDRTNELKLRLEAKNNEYENLRRNFEITRNERDHYIEESSKKEGEIDNLQRLLRNKNDTLEEEQTQVNTKLTMLKNTYEEKIRHLEKVIQESNGFVGLQDRKIEALNEQNTVICNQIRLILGPTAKKDDSVMTLVESVSKYVKELKQRTTDRSSTEQELRDQNVALHAKIRDNETLYTTLKQDLGKVVRELETKMNNDAKAREEERQNYIQTIERLQEQSKRPDMFARQLEERTMENAALKNAYMQKISVLNSEVTSLKSQNEKLREKMISHASNRYVKDFHLLIFLRELLDRNKNLEDTVQRLVEERNELKYELESIARASKSVIELNTPDEDRRDLNRSAREDRSFEEIRMLKSELDHSQSDLQLLTKKYKNIKDKYFRQSLRQNELQNYLVRDYFYKTYS